MKQVAKDGVVRVLSTSYCFYVLALLALVEYYAILSALGDTITFQEAQAQVRYSPPLPAKGEVPIAVPAPIAPVVEKREPFSMGNTEEGCRVRWAHPRQVWDGFNLPCPPAIAEQVQSKKPNALVQVASVVPQHRPNNKAQCVLAEEQWFCMPNFLIIGVPFAGSQTLLRWLEGHPRIASPLVQGPDYLNIPKGDLDDVWKYFAAKCPSSLVLPSPPEIAGYGDAERSLAGEDHGPEALPSPWAVGEVACYDHAPSLLSEAKAAITAMRAPWSRTASKILLLRDPADRLISHFFIEHPDWDWKDLSYAVKVSSGDFRECACDKISQLGSTGLCREASLSSSGTLWPLSVAPLMEKAYSQCKRYLEDTFLDQGFYHIHLQTWLSQGFRPEQFKIVFFEDLKTNSMETMSSVFQHVSLSLKGSEILELEQRLVAQYGRTSFPEAPAKQGMKTKEAAAVRAMLRTLYAQHNSKLNNLTEEHWGITVPWL